LKIVLSDRFAVGLGLGIGLWFGLELVLGLGLVLGLRVMVRALIKCAFARRAGISSNAQIDQMRLTVTSLQ